MRQTIRLPSLSSGVSAGGASTISLAPLRGYTYHRVIFDLLNVTNYQYITGVRVYLNGDIYQQFNGWQDLIEHNAYLNAQKLSDYQFLQIFFERPNLKDENQETLTSLYTGKAINDATKGIFTGVDVQTFTIEIDFNASVPTAFTPVCYGIVSDDQFPPNVIIRRTFGTYPLNNATGYNDIELPKGKSILLCEVKLNATNLTEVILMRDNYIIWQRTATLNAQIQKTENLRSSDTSYMYVIDPSENGEGDQPIQTTRTDGTSVSSMLCRLNIGVAQSSTVVGLSVLDNVR